MFAEICFLVAVGTIILVVMKIKKIFYVAPTPQLEDKWWGPGQETKVDTSIRPFKVDISDKVLIDLKQRLDNARPLTPPIDGMQQQYGMNTNLLSEIVDYWKNHYNWREREIFLNKYPQFKTNIQGLDIHFLHVKPTKTDGLKVLPLLLIHGWPGSVREFYEIIPQLTTPRKGTDFVFEVIAPSLPGFGFSQGASKPGLGAIQIGVVFKNLMARLGFQKYYLQGGDWGAIIVAAMSTLYQDRILGVHSNMCLVRTPLTNLIHYLGSFYPPLVVDKNFEHKLYPLASYEADLYLEAGYRHLQGTKPDTVGVALNDSPVGLAAYIIEKFTTWTNPSWKAREDGGLKEKYSYVDLLDNVMIYWVTNSITTSVRIYFETWSKANMALGLDSIPVKVPSAAAKFMHDILYHPDIFLKTKYKNLVHSSDFLDGGHFAAFEIPDVLADDIWTAVSKMEHFHRS